jgi:hypothetical protein
VESGALMPLMTQAAGMMRGLVAWEASSACMMRGYSLGMMRGLVACCVG